MSARLAVVVGGPSPEHDVSILTGLQAARALSGSGTAEGAGYDVSVLYWSKQGRWSVHEPTLEASAFSDGVPAGGREVEWEIGTSAPGLVAKGRLGRNQRVPVDLALVACHGAPGEDGHLQSLLELAGIQYTGPTLREAALCMDKLAFAAFAQSLGFPVARRILLAGGRAITPPFDGPYVLKPRFGGSSLGVEMVDDIDTAVTLAQRSLYAAGAYLEELKEGWWDVNVAIRSHPALELSLFERPLGKGVGALSYEDKYVAREGMAGAARELPAALSPGLKKEMSHAAEAIGMSLPVRGVMRLDFMTDGSSFIVNELNSVPGSWAKYLWGEGGAASFRGLLEGIIEEGRARPVGRWTSDGADGRLLRDAHSIASKLA